MKILNLKIFSPNKEVIRDIDFNENGISIILGDVLAPENKKKTSNSLGKSMLLKFIDYVYGANNDNKIIGKILENYVLVATVKFKEKKYLVERKLDSSQNIKIDTNLYTLDEYKNFFEIDRNLFHKQIVLKPRQGLISYNANPEKNDIVSFIKLLGLKNLLDKTEKIYNSQDKIKELKKTKKQMSGFLNENEKIDEKIFILNKEIEELEKNIIVISEKIKKLQTSEIKENIIEEYQIKNKEFKEKKEFIFSEELEIKRMEKFLKEYENIDVPSKIILSLYNKAKIEIPELIKRKVEEVENFHKNVYSDRKNILKNRMNSLLLSKNEKKEELKHLKEELDYLGNIISENKIYKENINLYEKYTLALNEKKYQQGQFSQIENVINEISLEDNNLIIYFRDLKQFLSQEENKEKIEKVRNFIYYFTQNIYDYKEKTSSYFDFEVRNKNQVTRPFKLDIKIDYDGGEGVNQVKKVMIDILLLKFNTLLNFFFQDSSVYEGVDPRQVGNILKEIHSISSLLNKQAIISINKYQIMQDEESLDFLEKYKIISFSEDEKLLKFNFK